jgi:hypothetical protein
MIDSNMHKNSCHIFALPTGPDPLTTNGCIIVVVLDFSSVLPSASRVPDAGDTDREELSSIHSD